MKKLISVCLVAVSAMVAKADTYYFTPSPVDLSDLDHRSAYIWGITGTSETSLKNQLASGYHITSATLTIKNLYNWDLHDTGNQLFMHLLDNPLTGVHTVTDDPNDNGVNQGVVSDYFSGNIPSNNGVYYSGTNIYLTQYHDGDGPTTHINYSFGFSASQVSILAAYISNGHTGGSSYADLGLGFDPDCHYYNDGVKLTVTTGQAVPEEGLTLVLLGIGFAALAGIRRLTRP